MPTPLVLVQLGCLNLGLLCLNITMLVKNLQAKSDHFVTKLTLSLDVRTTTWFFCRICIAISLSGIVNPLSGGDLDETYAEIENPPFKSWCSAAALAPHKLPESKRGVQPVGATPSPGG
jgi:hypothetical protein